MLRAERGHGERVGDRFELALGSGNTNALQRTVLEYRIAGASAGRGSVLLVLPSLEYSRGKIDIRRGTPSAVGFPAAPPRPVSTCHHLSLEFPNAA